MAEIKISDHELAHELIHFNIDDKDKDFESVRIAARNKAREINSDAMMLSWHNGKTGEFRPTYECGAGGEKPWVLYAESRGSNLIIDVNHGAYTFYFLKF